MRKRAITILLLCLAIFSVLPLATASASTSSVQIHGQGTLHFSGNLYGGTPGLYGPEGSFKVTNSSGQVVFSDYRATSSSPGYFSFSVPNLPLDTYTITGKGETPNTSVTFYQPSF
ncbi:hypothetical protein GK047_20730 [Paenibacillus sp. SYP-B3998]|uniref:Carboxypeptidase regulatory-like domain-containing protein n=1 Tax=Paenibacillus sp. SYP-B3998 TaxID=2678564 RepID=A0A6G4A449_9BACL|nr:hypothetical protein [Paenibacillus sp. SYP-B3998]NEW08427.1 hypothetical protein [Paenibacillus sp. SYP-B3998]